MCWHVAADLGNWHTRQRTSPSSLTSHRARNEFRSSFRGPALTLGSQGQSGRKLQYHQYDGDINKHSNGNKNKNKNNDNNKDDNDNDDNNNSNNNKQPQQIE